MEIFKYDGETEDELIYRICSMKEAIGTWKDVSEVLNELLGYEYDESCYRKKYQSFQKILGANKNKFADGEKQIEELERLQNDLRKERYKLQTVNLERNRIDRQDARQSLFFEQVSQYIQKMETPILKYEVNDTDEEIKYIQTIADIHYGSQFATDTNEYNTKIAKDRFEILLSETIKFIKRNSVDTLTIVLLGDMIQGILRMSDIAINETTVVKSCVDIARIISNYVNELSAYCKIELYDTVYANHSQIRYLNSQANSFPFEDLGFVIGNYIKDCLQFNDRVAVHLANEGESEIEINNIYNFNILATHGHLINNKKTYLQEISIRRRKFYDIVLFGHFHSEEVIINGEGIMSNTKTLVSPSFCGVDPYGQQFGNCKAGVNMYGIHKDYGHIKTETIILN